ncbi:MAG: HAMP domain-containing sensor histidine kinase [Lachnospiraceae bacterium]|nr:HAMP domain-containing sensor histidine kinase [Lachnospiraceae bacterium]
MKRSIAKQMTVIFIGLIAIALLANLLINAFFLENYYVMKQEKTLVSVYTLVDKHITQAGADESYFTSDSDFVELCSSNNIALVVLNSNYEPVLGTDDANGGRDGSIVAMKTRLWGYTAGYDNEDITVLTKTSNYTIQKKEDRMMQMDYLEIWGTLTYGDYFLMRIPMEGIRTSARISSEFIMYISIFVILLSMIFIIWISRKITRPLMELTELSKRMSDLDFDAKYTSGGENEIGQLGMHFNKMSEALEETISQLKTANNELQKDIEKKAQVDEMRKEFLSNVSHELKTPLALIQGYSEGLKECINDDAESRDFYCDVIMDEAGKMNQMVQKLLTLNQLEFGNDQLEMDRFDIVQLIQGKIMSTHILAQQKETQIFYDGSDCQHVWGDEFKVEEVLTNYLSNALNHVEGERKIEIRTSVQGKKVRISVFNTGQPIPEADLEQIWVKFYKVDKARTREYGGSGVGLSIVKAIMDSMHQAYGVKNFDNGVEFWFELENANGEQLNDTERGNTKQAETEIPQSE